MNQNLERAVFAFTATVFAVVLLVGLLVLGGQMTRWLALLAALFACGSQFAASSASGSISSYNTSLGLSYLSFLTAAGALAAFAAGA